MKTLLILRHAKSSWSNAHMSDHQRPLNDRGHDDAPRMGRLLRREDLVPDLIITSSAERALTTAEMAALAAGYEAELEVTRDFYLADPEAYIERLRALGSGPDRVMVVGHNPGVEELVELLSGQFERMPTAALAQIDLPIAAWSALSTATQGRLVNWWQPRDLAD